MFFIIFQFSLAQGQQCLELFSNRGLLNLEEYSHRRFQKSVDLLPAGGLSATAQKWRAKTGQPIFKFKNWFGVNKESHELIYLTAGEAFAISKSSTGVFRVFSAGKESQIAEWKLEDKDLSGARIEVIATSPEHVVVAVEDRSSLLRDESRGIAGFHPHRLFLYSLRGEKLADYGSDLRIKGSLITTDYVYWVNADQGSVYFTNLSTLKTTSLESYQLYHHGLDSAAEVINTIAISKDNRRLAVATSDRKGRQSAVFIFDSSALPEVKFLSAHAVPEGRIFGIEISDSELAVMGTPSGKSTDSAFDIERFVISLNQ